MKDGEDMGTKVAGVMYQLAPVEVEAGLLESLGIHALPTPEDKLRRELFGALMIAADDEARERAVSALREFVQCTEEDAEIVRALGEYIAQAAIRLDVFLAETLVHLKKATEE